jgi:hypothetical protein
MVGEVVSFFGYKVWAIVFSDEVKGSYFCGIVSLNIGNIFVLVAYDSSDFKLVGYFFVVWDGAIVFFCLSVGVVLVGLWIDWMVL